MNNNTQQVTDDIQNYIKIIRKKKLMSNERQQEIDELLKKDIDIELRNKLRKELVEGNLKFVISIAKKFQSIEIDLMDLISEGNIGLIKASERYDPNNGVKFITYAVWWIRQSIIAYLNDFSRTIRIPSNLVQSSLKQKRDEILSEDIIFQYEINLPYCVSLYGDDEEDFGLIDVLVDETYEPKQELDMKLVNNIKKMLNTLDDRERIIIENSFGFNGMDSNLDVLGEQFNCTKERIRQIRDKAIQKLRNESYQLINN